MTIDELEVDIKSAKWFSKLGQFPGSPKMVSIANLAAWSDENVYGDSDPIADEMNWLPTTMDARDPIHGNDLVESLKTRGSTEDATLVVKDIYRTALVSLRKATQNPLLKVGRHDFTKAARGAALYAIQHAAMEILAESRISFWSELIPLYRDGFWPCGLVSEQMIVVL